MPPSPHPTTAGAIAPLPPFTPRRPPLPYKILCPSKPSRCDSLVRPCAASATAFVLCFHTKCCPSANLSRIDALLPLQMTPLAHAAPQTIPPMHQNEPSTFEFSAVPSLLQRFPPPSYLRLLSNNSALQGLGILQSVANSPFVLTHPPQVFPSPVF